MGQHDPPLPLHQLRVGSRALGRELAPGLVRQFAQLIRAVRREAHELDLLRRQLGAAPCVFDLGAQVLLDGERGEVPEEMADALHAREG